MLPPTNPAGEYLPEPNLPDALSYYAWHGRHHAAQITWLREQHAW